MNVQIQKLEHKDKRFYIIDTQIRSAVKPAQHPHRYRKERRVPFWRVMAGMFILFACLFIALELGAFDWIVS